MKEQLEAIDRLYYEFLCRDLLKPLSKIEYKELKNKRDSYYKDFDMSHLDPFCSISETNIIFLMEDLRKDVFNRALRISAKRHFEKKFDIFKKNKENIFRRKI